MNQPLLQMDLRLVVGALVVLAGAVIAIWLVGRRFRADLGPTHTLGQTPPAPSAPSNVVRELQARGLATPAQLAGMTETERQLLFATAASMMLRASEEERSIGERVTLSVVDLPPLFCPLCGYRLEQFTSTPPITGKCETCQTRVVVRRDGVRLLLTVLTPEAQQDIRL